MMTIIGLVLAVLMAVLAVIFWHIASRFEEVHARQHRTDEHVTHLYQQVAKLRRIANGNGNGERG